jgi:hypothetical protein
MREVDRWIESGTYQAVLDGDYPRREDDPASGAWEAWKESAETYREGLRQTTDPLASWMRETGAAAADRAGTVLDWFRRSPRDDENP